MSNLTACFSTGKDDWETPDDLFRSLNEKYHFVLDAAANEVNHKCAEWLGPGGTAEDAISTDVNWQHWLRKGHIWLNPPYSRGLQSAFVQRASHEAMISNHGNVICLLPARTDTKLFHTFIYNKPNVDVTFLRGRLKFKGANAGAPFPSMIVVFS